jgi:hypothetical protein
MLGPGTPCAVGNELGELGSRAGSVSTLGTVRRWGSRWDRQVGEKRRREWDGRPDRKHVGTRDTLRRGERVAQTVIGSGES